MKRFLAFAKCLTGGSKKSFAPSSPGLDSVLKDTAKLPRHIAIIMDGNGRWAKKRMLPRSEGHRQGAKTVRVIVEECLRLGIRYLTVYAFSTENWKRPGEEIKALMFLFKSYLESELELFKKHNIRLRSIGDRSRLPEEIRALLNRCEEETKSNTALDFVLAVSYGGRDEIVNAARSIAVLAAEGKLKPGEVTEESFSEYLFAPDVPDPDLLIRTSDELRISNFLLWQLAYSEIIVSPVLWPDFSRDEFHRCLLEFAGRTRRFGFTQEQLEHDAANG